MIPFARSWSHPRLALNSIRTLTLALALSGAVVADDGAVIFEGYDPLWQAPTVIVERGGRYYMDGDEMDKLRHPNMPADGLSLALRDRRGNPDNYFLIRDRKMDIYIDCEFGPCSLKRSIDRSK